jgi:formate-dependent nitrite reductase cytochrome c552 subunit
MRSIVILSVLCAALGFAQPKNLQILKPEEIRPVMGSFVAGTGLKCGDCHDSADMSSDAKPQKVTARKMLAMVRGINANTFNGDQKVTCYTCHRGEAMPKSTP